MVATVSLDGIRVHLQGAGPRWHLWLEGVPTRSPDGVLPFFKAVGAVAPASNGVLEVATRDPERERWIMLHGSVTAYKQVSAPV